MVTNHRDAGIAGIVTNGQLRRALELFDLQVWLWGQDIVHPRGNGLLRFGFQRQPPPRHVDAASIYRLQLPRRRRVVLRGYGMLFSDARMGGLYLERFVFQPQWTAALDLSRGAWHRPLLRDLRVPASQTERHRTRRLLYLAVEWMAAYERWAWHHLGHAHRRRAVAEWRRLGKPTVAAGNLADAWLAWWDSRLAGCEVQLTRDAQ